jgi:hypothetical protein
VGGLVQRVGHVVQFAAGQAQQAVADVVAFEQDEHQQHDDDARRHQGFEHGRQQLLQGLQRRLVGGCHLHAQRLSGRTGSGGGMQGLARLVHLGFHRAQQPRSAVQRSLPFHRLAQRAQLGLDGGLVLRQVAAQLHHLARQQVRPCRQHGHGGGGDHADRQGARQAPAPQPAHQRVQQEGQQRGQRQRHEDVAAERQRSHHDRGHHRAQRQQRGFWQLQGEGALAWVVGHGVHGGWRATGWAASGSIRPAAAARCHQRCARGGVGRCRVVVGTATVPTA